MLPLQLLKLLFIRLNIETWTLKGVRVQGFFVFKVWGRLGVQSFMVYGFDGLGFRVGYMGCVRFRGFEFSLLKLSF